MTKTVLGHIECPSCGTPKGMRVTLDKNGEPFGFCEVTCGQQLRIGGDKTGRRVARFVARYPWASEAPVTATATATATVTEPGPAPAAPKPAPVAAPAPAPAPAPAKAKPAAPPPAPPAPPPKAKTPWFATLLSEGSSNG